eukprot:1483741-Pyramimonas_sp.AAC.1
MPLAVWRAAIRQRSTESLALTTIRSGRFVLVCISILTDQSDAGSAGIFSQRTNQTREARVYSHDRPIRRRKVGC